MIYLCFLVLRSLTDVDNLRKYPLMRNVCVKVWIRCGNKKWASIRPSNYPSSFPSRGGSTSMYGELNSLGKFQSTRKSEKDSGR